jgi:HSP20 family protein
MDDFDRRIIEELKEMERQMGRMLRNTALTRMMPLSSCSEWEPAVDVYETTDDIIVYMDTAGIDMDNLTVIAEKTKVIVEGRRALPKRGNICCIHQLEIELGCFKRTMSFPVAVAVSSTSVNCKNGILEIRLPKQTPSCSVP